MKKILLSDLKAISAERPSGYYDELVSAGQIETVEILVLSEADYAAFNLKFAQPIRPLQPVQRKDWPIWAKALALLAKPEDKGVGDVVLRTIGETNSDKFKAWHKLTFGKDCNCKARQKQWNIQYPL